MAAVALARPIGAPSAVGVLSLLEEQEHSREPRGVCALQSVGGSGGRSLGLSPGLSGRARSGGRSIDPSVGLAVVRALGRSGGRSIGLSVRWAVRALGWFGPSDRVRRSDGRAGRSGGRAVVSDLGVFARRLRRSLKEYFPTIFFGKSKKFICGYGHPHAAPFAQF